MWRTMFPTRLLPCLAKLRRGTSEMVLPNWDYTTYSALYQHVQQTHRSSHFPETRNGGEILAVVNVA